MRPSREQPLGYRYVDRGPMNFITAHIYRRGGSGSGAGDRVVANSLSLSLHRLRDKPPGAPRILLRQISALLRPS